MRTGHRTVRYQECVAPTEPWHQPCWETRLTIFEVDHPAMQGWKHRLLSAACIPTPTAVTFVPVNFEADSLIEQLAGSGFDLARPALVSWLGVSMYLTRAAISARSAKSGASPPAPSSSSRCPRCWTVLAWSRPRTYGSATQSTPPCG